MLRFSDFSHLPEIDEQLRRLLDEPGGLVVVAGLDSRAGGADLAAGTVVPFLASGRATIFRVLVGELLDAHPDARCAVVAEDKDVLHVARRFRGRIEQTLIKSPMTYAEAIEQALGRKPGLLVVDRIGPDNAAAVLAAARDGARVVSQLDTIYHAQAAAQFIAGMGPAAGQPAGLRWILSVQRLPTLCPICKQPAEVTGDQLAVLQALSHRYPSLEALHAPPDGGAFYRPGACDKCRRTGRQGDVAVFDFLRMEDAARPWDQPSALPMEAYVWMLAQRGQLALSDALEFESHQLRRTYNLLMTGERQLAEATAALERKSAELDTANRLLRRRTRELVSLEGIGQALLTWHDLRELGGRVLKAAMELSKADRGALYYVRSADWGQIIASRGWGGESDELGLARSVIYEQISDREPGDFTGPPPGISVSPDSPLLRAGQAIPLVAHGIPTGLMLIQSTRKRRFAAGETALLQTLAGYAAVAMQRAGLIDQLKIKIEELQLAQEELAQKERLEREMELARQVQVSMLPRSFPDVAGLSFAAAYAPARHVGGDFYDVIPLNDKGGDDGLVALVIADVADKGMPAALYMALARSLILAEARRTIEPLAVLHHVNQLLLELGEQDMFVTVFYGVLDPARGRLTYARAGHDHPFLVRDGGVTQLDGRGMPLGIFDGDLFTLTQEETGIRPGDRLMLYTDGLTDSSGPDNVMLGSDRLSEMALAHAHLPAAEMCSALFEHLHAYRQGTPQFDDMALLVVGVE